MSSKEAPWPKEAPRRLGLNIVLPDVSARRIRQECEIHAVVDHQRRLIRGEERRHCRERRLRDELGRPLKGAEVRFGEKRVTTDAAGHYTLLYRTAIQPVISIGAPGFFSVEPLIQTDRQEQDVVLIKKDKDWQFRLLELLR